MASGQQYSMARQKTQRILFLYIIVSCIRYVIAFSIYTTVCFYFIFLFFWLYSIENQPYNTMVVFKIRDSVLSTRYSSICNVLRPWSISLIPTYRVYRLYDTYACAQMHVLLIPCLHWHAFQGQFRARSARL